MINVVRVSKEYPAASGNMWISMEGTTDPGQTPEELANEIISRSDKFMQVRLWGTSFDGRPIYSEPPVIQIGDDQSREDILKNIHKK